MAVGTLVPSELIAREVLGAHAQHPLTSGVLRYGPPAGSAETQDCFTPIEGPESSARHQAPEDVGWARVGRRRIDRYGVL